MMHFTQFSVGFIVVVSLGLCYVDAKLKESVAVKDPESCDATVGPCSKKTVRNFLQTQTTKGAKPLVDPDDYSDVCINQDRCCDVWASVGECKRKTKFMDNNCPRSCKTCTYDNKNNTDCHDLFPKCAEWATKDECKKNLAWMEENCPKSCEVCSRTPDELREICGARLTTECKNYFNDCGKWAGEGECKSNAWWMEQNCPLACGSCKQ